MFLLDFTLCPIKLHFTNIAKMPGYTCNNNENWMFYGWSLLLTFVENEEVSQAALAGAWKEEHNRIHPAELWYHPAMCPSCQPEVFQPSLQFQELQN